MENINALSSWAVWAVIIAILILHLLTAAIKSKSDIAALAATCINAALHLALVVVMLAKRAYPEELFFAMLLSAAAAFILTKTKKGDNGNGI